MTWAAHNFERLAFSLVADDAAPLAPEVLGEARAALADPAFFAFAEANQVAPHIFHRLRDALGEDALPAAWRQAHEQNERRIAQYMQVLDRVAAILAAENIRLVALKNAGIARGIYPCVACCPMGDVDSLVSPGDFRRAHHLLVHSGFRFEFRSPLEEAELQAAEHSGGAEYEAELPGGGKLWFELQRRPVAGRWIRPDQEPPADELLARAVPIAGSAVRLLAPEDNLLQVCLHTAKHSFVRGIPGIRLHTDVDRIARRQPIDWELFLTRVRTMQVKTAVYFSLLIPQQIFGTPVPAGVLAALRPGRWKERYMLGWVRRARLFDPEKQRLSKAEYIFFTSCLYDDARGLLRGIFPARAWMRERYGFRSSLLLPVYHARRLTNLLLRRTL
jgi:hypothetical protein